MAEPRGAEFMEMEAERDADEGEEPEGGQFEDSSEEDEDDQDSFEKDDFIVDDADDDDGHESDAKEGSVKKAKKKKRRRYREDSPELAEGDLELLAEKGVRVDRTKKLRRLKKGTADDDDDDNGLDDLDGDVRGLADDEDRYDPDRRRDADDNNVDYDDDLDDFIDDGGRGKRRRAAERKGLVSSEAVRAARSIFGDVDEMTQYRGVGKLFQKAGGPDGEEDDDPDFSVDKRPSSHGGDGGFDDAGDEDHLDGEDDDDDDDDVAGGRRARASRGRTDKALDEAIVATAAVRLGEKEVNTEEIDRVVAADVPEELQAHFGTGYSTPTEEELRIEARWVYKHGFEADPVFLDYQRFDPDKFIDKIFVFLSYVHIDKLDVPFVAMYRKDYVMPELIPAAGEHFRVEGEVSPLAKPTLSPKGFNSQEYEDLEPGLSIEHLRGVPPGYDDGFGDWSLLWRIMDWDKKYANMQNRAKELIATTKVAASKGVPAKVIAEVSSLARTCDNELRLGDGERFLRLAVELATALSPEDSLLVADGEQKEGSQRKKPIRRKNRYGEYCKKGYRELSEQFGLDAHDFGENVSGGAKWGEGAQIHTALDPEEEPLHSAKLVADKICDIAAEAGNPQPTDGEIDPHRLLAAAGLILVAEFSSDLRVVNTARSILCSRGTVTINTTPTAQGIAQVGNMHPLRRVTYICGKTVERFTNSTEFALIRRAVELGFTEVKVTLREDQVASLRKVLTDSFIVPMSNSPAVEAWNRERQKVVDAVLDSLTRRMMAEVYDQLVADTTLTLRSRLSKAASRRLLLGTSRPVAGEDGAPQVLAISVTREEDEEPDPSQAERDADEAKERGAQAAGGRRVARERITFAVVDENGEHSSSQELFAGWLRRPMGKRNPNSRLPDAVRAELMRYVAKVKPQTIVIGVGSGGRSTIRFQEDLILEVLLEMARSKQLGFMLSSEHQAELKSAASKIDHDDEAEHEVDRARRIFRNYVFLVDDWPARTYAKTSWASVGLSVDGMTLLEKRAIALARLAQNPLTVYSAIGREEHVAEHFKIHPYHYFVGPADRIKALNRALVRAVCTNGVDINRILSIPHIQPLLSYVGGLGVHKSKALVLSLETTLSEEDRGLASRKHLWSQNLLGRIVFLSAAAFIRVRDPSLHPGGSTSRAVDVRRSRLERKSRGRRRDDDDGTGLFDPMDDSRIHPEHYPVAIKIADEALRDDDGNLAIDLSNDSSGISDAMRVTSAVLDDPSGLQRLDLDQYAEHLERLGRGRLYETVKLIGSEFVGPFRDYRRPLVSPEPEAIFYLVTSADPMLVRVGAAVTGTNCKVVRSHSDEVAGVSCMLPHDIRGFVFQGDFSDSVESLSSAEFENLVPNGSSLACRIVSFQYEKFEAKLTSQPSLMDNVSGITGYVPLLDRNDECFKEYPAPSEAGLPGRGAGAGRSGSGTSARDRGDIRRRRHMSRLRQKAKPIVGHEFFRDISGTQAVEILRNGLPGDIIIRPSPYTKDGFIFTCKFASFSSGEAAAGAAPQDIFHVDCSLEFDKSVDAKVPIRLKVHSQVFEHVDEVLEGYLQPVMENMKECLEHRKFRLGTPADLERMVKSDKERTPLSIPYYFGLHGERSMALVMVYIPGTKSVRRETISVVPDGYKLRNVLHKNMDVLCTWFKKNMRKSSAARRPAPAGDRVGVGASPYGAAASPFASAASPFRTGASPYSGAASPFAAAQSPFRGPSSYPGTAAPYAAAAASPFYPASTPYGQGAPPPGVPPPGAPPPGAPPTGPGRGVAPVMDDAPPPAAPGQNFQGQLDPYGGGSYEWGRAGPPMDGPPPPRGVPSGGSYRHSGPPPPPIPGPRGPPLRGPPPPPRGPPPPPRGPPPPPRGRPRAQQAQQDPAASVPWRGSKPVPAWATKQNQ